MSKPYKIQLVKKKRYFIRLVSVHNGETLMVSETYKTKWNARRAALKLVAANGFRYEEII